MSKTATDGPDRALRKAGVCYEIRMEGHLDECWAERFGDVSLTHVENGETLVVGLFRDQAALFGVLLQIHGLGVSLISVHRRTVLPEVADSPSKNAGDE